MFPHDSEALLEAGSASALTHAEAYVRRSLFADGSADGEDGGSTGSETDFSLFRYKGREALSASQTSGLAFGFHGSGRAST